MLFSLHIENIAVIKCSDIDFKSGFTVFTGETGAGKSIIIDSVNFLLGNRGDRELIRSGESTALVSAVFGNIDNNSVKQLEEYGIVPDENGELVLQRTMGVDGRGSVKINGRPYSVSMLKSAASTLINIHGQHDSKFLLDAKKHIGVLDSYADNSELLSEYGKKYSELVDMKNEIKKLNELKEDNERVACLMKLQIEEIDKVKPQVGEEEKLIQRQTLLKGIEKVSKQVRFVYKALYANEKGVSAANLARKSAEALSVISGSLENADEYIEKLNSFACEMEEIALSAKELIGDVNLDPTAELNKIEARLYYIEKLKRVYGNTVEEVLSFREKLKEGLHDIENADENFKIAMKNYTEKRQEAVLVADKINENRVKAAERLEKEVCDCLSFLEMPKVKFKVDIVSNKEKLGRLGYDTVEFLLSANVGEELKPLSKIASGGELSRIMLGLKSVLRNKESTDTIIFDEVDSGISGKTSQKVGIKLKETASDCQVICITHSAQIAALAHNHLLIKKEERKNRVESFVTVLGKDERVAELARIMGGTEQTETLLKSAEELLELSLKY